MSVILEFPYGRDVALTEGRSIEVWTSAGAIFTPTLESIVRASRVLTAAGAFSDGDTVTIQRATPQQGAAVNLVYTLKTALTPTRGEVLIGGSIDNALTNLARAMNGTGTPGTDYATGTPPVGDFLAVADTGVDTLTLTALNGGDAYNTAVAAFAESGVNTSWAAATNGVDSPDWQEAIADGSGEAAYANMSATPVVRNDAMKFCPIASQLTGKGRRFRIADNAGAAFESRHIDVITTDHPAAGKTNGALYAGVLDDPTDLAVGGLTVEIPNSAHADWNDWLDGPYSVPNSDDIIKGDWMYLFDPDTGAYGWAEIKSYDFDGGTGNQGLITFTTGAGVKIAATLRAALRLWYVVYSSNPSIVPEIAAGAVSAAAVGTGAIDADAIAAAALTAAKFAANAVDANALAADAVDKIIDEVIEGAVTMRQMLRGFAAALLAKASGLDTTTAVYRDIGDTKPRITATVDANGNRSAVTLDLT